METKYDLDVRWQLSRFSWMGFWFWCQWKHVHIKCSSGISLFISGIPFNTFNYKLLQGLAHNYWNTPLVNFVGSYTFSWWSSRANCLRFSFFFNSKELYRYYKGADICMVVASVSHMLTLRSSVMLSAKVPFLSVLSQVIVNLKSLNSGFLFYWKYHSLLLCLLCFIYRWHLKIQRYKGYISSLTANRLVYILCPVLS